MWFQKEFSLKARKRGIHLVTAEVLDHLPELNQVKTGLLHLLLKHTSASLTVNENADPDVRIDMENWLNRIAPENEPYYKHTLEGSDDMPAHLKSVMMGPELTLPVHQGRLRLGTWQGIYLCEHRNHGGNRSLVATIHGD